MENSSVTSVIKNNVLKHLEALLKIAEDSNNDAFDLLIQKSIEELNIWKYKNKPNGRVRCMRISELILAKIKFEQLTSKKIPDKITRE